MKKILLAILTLGIVSCQPAQAWIEEGPILERISFRSDGDAYRAEVAFDVGEFFALFRKSNDASHMRFETDYSGNFVAVEKVVSITPEQFAALAQDLPTQPTHWDKYGGGYKVSAVIAAVGVAVALILEESGGGGQDGDVNINGNGNSVGGRDTSASTSSSSTTEN